MKSFTTFLLGNKFVFTTDNGVFSKTGLDFGTRNLLETIPLSLIHGDILDVGCGYGAIGIVLKKITDSNVWMCDVNKRALHLAKINAEQNRVDVTILESDCYQGIDVNQKFDVIITNPPIRAGKKVVYEIVMGAREHLKPDGKLFLVVRKEQGAKSMISDLQEYYHVVVLDKIKGFFIVQCDFN